MLIKRIQSISFTLIFLLAFLFAFTAKSNPVFAQESKTNESLSVNSISSEISPQIVYSYTKTITQVFDSYPVPSTYNYTEYRDDFKALFSGTLSLVSVTASGSLWKATYTGTMIGRI